MPVFCSKTSISHEKNDNIDIFIQNIQKNPQIFSLFNKHFHDFYHFLQEIFNKNYQNLFKSLISLLNDFMQNFSRNSFRNSPKNSTETFSHAKSSIFPSLNSFSDIISKNPENSLEFRCFEPFSDKNIDFSRRKWGPKFIKMKKIPIPAYKLFKRPKFDNKVMPSLKGKYLANLSLKEMGKTEDFIAKKPEKIHKKEEIYKEISRKIGEFSSKNQEKSGNFNENYDSFHLKNPINMKNSMEIDDKSLRISEKNMRIREKSLLNVEKPKENVNNSPKLKTGGDGLNLFTNFKARMSQKYKK